jgi:adenine C2-methylase RlmN of 23S rRNA A2503 and tRNA A37
MVRKLVTTSLVDDVRMTRLFEARGWKTYHLNRVWHFLIKKRAGSLANVDSVPAVVLSELSSDAYSVCTTTVVSASTCADGSTTKLLIRLQDGHLIEVS